MVTVWRRSTCRREIIILSSEVGEIQRELGITLIFGDIRISYLFDEINIPLDQGKTPDSMH